MGNTFGRIFRLTTWGESHGPTLGGIIDGCPAGISVSEQMIQQELDLRRPGQTNSGATSRNEKDRVRLLSGVFDNLTTGTPIAFMVDNEEQHSGDYAKLANVFRPGHADFTYHEKFGGIRDWRGGGRSSGRETVSRVAGGAIAQALLDKYHIKLNAFTVEYGGIKAPVTDKEGAANRLFFAPDEAIVDQWKACVDDARASGNTLGGVVQIEATGVPTGLGEPVFDKIDAVLAQAIMSVGTIKVVEIGDGFAVAQRSGVDNNDAMTGYGEFASNHAGGILGGITTGQPIIVRGWVKPIASIPQPQHTVDTKGNPVTIEISGRHDVSAIPRIVPVLKAMTALVLADFILLQESRRRIQNYED